MNCFKRGFIVEKGQYYFVVICILYLIWMMSGLDIYRPIRCDEAWYSNTGLNFCLGRGFINDITYMGGNSNFFLPLLLGLAFKFLGFSLFTARFVSVMTGLFFLIGLKKLYDYYSVSIKIQLLSFLFFLSISFFYSIFSYARPEGLTTVLLLYAIINFIKFLDGRTYYNYYLMSFQLYFAFLSHPFMSIYFLCIGLYLVYVAVSERNLKLIYHLLFLVFIGVFAIITTALAHCYYNLNSNKLVDALIAVFNRTSLRNVQSDTLFDRVRIFYEQYILSYRVIFFFPTLIIVVIGLFLKNKMIQVLSIMSIIHLTLTFIIFKNDLGMFPTSHTYFIASSIVIMPFVLLYLKNSIKLIIITILFILINGFSNVYYNIKRKDDVNRILVKDLQKFIPDSSNVYGPIECWFFLPSTKYISNMYKAKIDFSKIDFVILRNTQPGEIFKNYNKVYSSHSSQYGDIIVYRK